MKNFDRATTATITGFCLDIDCTGYSQDLTSTIRTELYLILDQLYKAGYRTFLCSLESDFDLLAAKTVSLFREVKSRGPVQLVAILDHCDPPKAFGPAAAALFREICHQSDEVVDLSSWIWLPMSRNKYFLKNSSHIVCMDTGNLEDTYRLALDAEKEHIPVTNLFDLIK